MVMAVWFLLMAIAVHIKLKINMVIYAIYICRVKMLLKSLIIP